MVTGLLVVAAGLAGLAGAALRARAGDRAVARPLLVAGLLLAAAGAVFVLVAADETLAAADAPVLGLLVRVRGPGLTAVARAVSLVGGTVVTGGAAVVAAVVLVLRGRRARGVVWVVGVAVGALTIRLLKEAVERSRPPTATRLAAETTSSLPSGHSLMAALGLGLVGAAVAALAGRTARAVVGALAGAAVLAIGASRAYLGVHWTTDVLSGWLLGGALALLCLAAARALEIPAGRRGARRSSPPSPPEHIG